MSNMNGKELFRETNAEFKYWWADAYGISPSFDQRSYEDMSVEEAIEIATELLKVARFCMDYQEDFPALRGDD